MEKLLSKNFPEEEYIQLLTKLDEKHAIFYKLWEMGRPEFVYTPEEVKTAGVVFDETGECIRFIINYNFWQTLNENQKLFVICHECLHIILEHGKRFFSNNPKDHLLMNYATDIFINHYAVNTLKFSRKEIDPNNNYCWVDSFFDPETSQNESAEWYYNKLKSESSIDKKPELVDDHNIQENGSDFSSVIEKLNEELSDEEKELVKNILEQEEVSEAKSSTPGTIGGSLWKFVDVTKKVAKKKKWETVIRNWAISQIRRDDKEETQWARINRRFVTLDDDMFLPTEMELEAEEKVKDKIEVWFFQDTSGSCSGYTKRFFTAARTLPEDKFNVKMHCFDTSVYETTLKSGRLYGFGGTTFSCIENYISRYTSKNKVSYPKAVFVITDGFGDYVNPKKPEVWHWFLTPYSSRHCIPKKSKVYSLKDYE